MFISNNNENETQAGSGCFLNVFEFLAPKLSRVCFTMQRENIKMMFSLEKHSGEPKKRCRVSLNSTEWAILSLGNHKGLLSLVNSEYSGRYLSLSYDVVTGVKIRRNQLNSYVH